MNYRPITDVWILARPKVKYYGAYPNGFLERARALLGVTPFDPVLHVCGGAARQYPARPRGFGRHDQTLDLDPALHPDFLQAATDPIPRQRCQGCRGTGQVQHEFGFKVCRECGGAERGDPWPALLADPPYTEADAAKYAPGASAFPSPNVVLRNMLAVVRPGGRVGMLHYVLPQPPNTGVRFVACVGVIAGYNNRMRVFSVFEREATA